MTTKKLLIVANKCVWKSWPDKIAELQQWYRPKVSLQVTFMHSSFENIPFIQYENPVPDQAQYKKRLGVDYEWYDLNISPLAKDFDMVLFVINSKDWPAEGDMRGWRVDRTYGAVELQIGAGENEMYRWGSYTGGGFFNFARHEIMHALFMITGQPDTTHFWWNQSPEKLTNSLNELSFPEAREAEEISRLQKIISFLMSLIGLQKQLNTLKMEEAKSLEEKNVMQKDLTRKAFCLAIQEYEGYFAPGENPKYPGGTMAWKNKNPGNLKYAGQIGSIGKNNGFAVFSDYATGFAALMRQVEAACTGRSKVFSPNMNFTQFFQKYAPSTDNNDPNAYANFVAKRLGVDSSFVIKNLSWMSWICDCKTCSCTEPCIHPTGYIYPENKARCSNCKRGHRGNGHVFVARPEPRIVPVSVDRPTVKPVEKVYNVEVANTSKEPSYYELRKLNDTNE